MIRMNKLNTVTDLHDFVSVRKPSLISQSIIVNPLPSPGFYLQVKNVRKQPIKQTQVYKRNQ